MLVVKSVKIRTSHRLIITGEFSRDGNFLVRRWQHAPCVVLGTIAYLMYLRTDTSYTLTRATMMEVALFGDIIFFD